MYPLATCTFTVYEFQMACGNELSNMTLNLMQETKLVRCVTTYVY